MKNATGKNAGANWAPQVLLAIMSGVFGLAGWHFCKLERERYKTCGARTDVFQPVPLPVPHPSELSPRQMAVSHGKRLVDPAHTNTTPEVTLASRRMLHQH
jgi:hypothetical protein